MSLINRALNAFTNWALARGVDPDPNSKEPKPWVWAYTISDYIDGAPYLTRVLFPRIFGFRPMLHHFHRPDGDRALHNHPWAWAFSLVLRGWYEEERRLDAEEVNGTSGSAVVTRAVRWFNILTDRDFHRVTELHGEVWTLFVTGPRTQGWGFDENGDGEVTNWREYIDRKKAEHEASQLANADREALSRSMVSEIAELGRLTGDALDMLGAAHDVKRSVKYKLEGTNSVIDAREPDDSYRSRIYKAIRANWE